jgi:hypothetical protein
MEESRVCRYFGVGDGLFVGKCDAGAEENAALNGRWVPSPNGAEAALVLAEVVRPT